VVIHRFREERYKEELLKLIKGGEGFSSQIYSDKGGIPTIGYGYALLTKKGDRFIPRPSWKRDFERANIDISWWEEEKLEDFLEEIANNPPITREKTEKKLREYYQDDPVSALEITEDEAKSLFFVAVEWYQNFVKRKIGEEAYRYYQYSREFIPLVSMAYNRPALFNNPNLIKAIKNFDRVRAYMEIVYHSNPDKNLGIASRRKREGDYFGIWDRKEPSIEESLHFFEVFNGERMEGIPVAEYVKRYEREFAPVFGLKPGAVAYRGKSILAYADQAFGQVLAYFPQGGELSADRTNYHYPIYLEGTSIRIG